MILVTGGTGLVGSHLLYALLSKGLKVRAIYRASSSFENVKKVFKYYTNDSNAEILFNTIIWFKTSINDIPQLTLAFKEVQYVYHCAAFIDFDSKNYKTLKKTNLEGTANIVNLAITNGVKKLCYVSSIATMGGKTDGSLIDEETYFNAEEDNSVYGITKYDAEMEVWRGTQEGLDAVIVNPGVIFGAGFWKKGSGSIFNIGSRGIPYYTTGSLGVVDVLDVVQAMTKLMESAIINERFILVSQNISYKYLLSSLAAHFNKKPPKKALARWKLVAVSIFEWVTHALFRTNRRLVKATLNSLYKTSRYKGSKIEEQLTFKYTPFAETLERIILRYKSES
jgi:nucleoside-diphosphate-sugar epimerase